MKKESQPLPENIIRPEPPPCPPPVGITPSQLTKLVVGVDKVVYAGARYKFYGTQIFRGETFVMIEDEPGHIDMIRPESLSTSAGGSMPHNKLKGL